MKVWMAVSVAVFALGAPHAASAQALGMIELRGGVFANADDAETIDPSHVEDINVEVLLGLPVLDALSPLGSVRPHVGATINTDSKASMAYAGASWTVPLGFTPFFAEAGIGAAVAGDDLGDAVSSASDPGCRLRARASGSLGVQVTESIGVMGTLDHARTTPLCDEDAGIDPRTGLGVRLGWKF
ncbi:hypothetical protein GCM10007989_20380 [Devosia pacifica]|uniref:Outer membrane protein beta-barrel domain-containing protein n=1 Tax=Devosia pacifica TaxID=1335967 RepID=A0A918VS91_9HYPH|nr:hypothetical protein [Devosia pacifica]GHA24642.1 hypothetical protein GCM10007989_20380 [Devosia pacifica]